MPTRITGLTNGTDYTVGLLRVLEKDGEPYYDAFQTQTARPNNVPTGVPVISGTARVGQTLTVDISGVSDADGIDEYVLQWMEADQSMDRRAR